MTDLLGQLKEPISNWKTSYYYCYEIVNRGNGLELSMSVGSLNIDEEQEKKCLKLGAIAKTSNFKENWTWKKIKVFKKYDCSEISAEDIEVFIFSSLDNELNSIKGFEGNVVQKWRE